MENNSLRRAVRYISLALVCVLFIGLIPRIDSEASIGYLNYYPYRAVSSLGSGGKLKAATISLTELRNNTKESYLLAQISKPDILTAVNTLSQVESDELSVILVALCILKYKDKSEEITLTEETAKTINATGLITDAETLNVYELRAGTTLTVEVLLNAYLLSGNTRLRDILLDYTYKNPNIFERDVRYITKKLKTLNTRYNAHTTIYDLYLLIDELMKYDTFINCIGAEYLEFLYADFYGKEVKLRCYNANKAEAFTSVIPESYNQAGNLGDSILILTDKDSNYYMAIASKCEMSKVLYSLPIIAPEEPEEELKPIPEKAVIPTESNEARYEYLFGKGTPVEYYTMERKSKGYETAAKAKRNMKTISVPVWKIDSKGNRYSSKYSLTIHKSLVESVKGIFNEIYELNIKFPIKYMIGYSYRKVGGVGLMNSRLMSIHSFGAAIDINPGDYDNDYYLGYGNDLRDKENPYCIPQEVIDIFARYGWYWGGDFKICADTMHFQYLGLDFLDYEQSDGFPVLEFSDSVESNKYVVNLQTRLVELNYMSDKDVTGIFNIATRGALIRFQLDNGLSTTGKTDYKTWETIINLTHYMQYEF